MKEKNIYTALPYFQPFPDAEAVFGAAEREVLLPIGLLDFSVFDSTSIDQILIALPIEPYEGELGDDAEEFHTASCKPYRYGYSLKDGNWQLDCDPRFFLRFLMSEEEWEDSYMPDFYRDVRASYDKAKSFYQKHHFLDGTDYAVSEDEPANSKAARKGRTSIMTLGGCGPSAEVEDWVPFKKLPAEFNEEFQEFEYAVYNEAGRRYHYIGHVPGGKCNNFCDGAYFFYDPISKNVRAILDSPVVGGNMNDDD